MKEIEGPKVEISTVEINAVVFIALVHLLCSRTFYTGTGHNLVNFTLRSESQSFTQFTLFSL